MNQEDFKKRYKYDPSTDRLGEGGFGEVFKTYDTFLDRWVAIKISKVRADFQEIRLKNEVDLLNQLPAHPNVARYEECYTFRTISGEHDFAILQYYEVGNLLQVLRKYDLSLSQKYYLLSGLLEGIRFIHSQGIIHRDLKPQNVLIVYRDNNYIPKITDFGISKKLNLSKSTQFSNSLIGAGTITYSSPEQLADNAIRKNADLWSFGIIAFQVLTGETPFNSGTHSTSSELGRQEMMKQISSGKLPDSIKNVPAPWKQIIENCLVIDPNNRIKDVESCINILRGVNPSETKMRTYGKMAVEEDETQIVSGGSKTKKKKFNSQILKKSFFAGLLGILAIVIFMVITFTKQNTNKEKITPTQNDSLPQIQNDGLLQTNKPEETAVIVLDTLSPKEEFKQTDTSEKNPEKKSTIVTLKDGKIEFPDGSIYTGHLLNGEMHGKGKLWFKTGGLISKNDPMERSADADDYVEGEWVNGELYIGNLYDKNGKKKSRIVIGRN
jgi:serine/threonine protein kinase